MLYFVKNNFETTENFMPVFARENRDGKMERMRCINLLYFFVKIILRQQKSLCPSLREKIEKEKRRG